MDYTESSGFGMSHKSLNTWWNSEEPPSEESLPRGVASSGRRSVPMFSLTFLDELSGSQPSEGSREANGAAKRRSMLMLPPKLLGSPVGPRPRSKTSHLTKLAKVQCPIWVPKRQSSFRTRGDDRFADSWCNVLQAFLAPFIGLWQRPSTRGEL